MTVHGSSGGGLMNHLRLVCRVVREGRRNRVAIRPLVGNYVLIGPCLNQFTVTFLEKYLRDRTGGEP
jgi:hypothetical protein